MGLIVTITEQSGNDLTDYQIRIEITDPNFFQECTDQKYIECYFQDGSWIPHYTELFNPSENKAVIWVKVPFIPANGTVKVLIKVNPSRTEDLSDAEAVFDFFDNFEEDSLDITKWDQTKGTYSISNSVITLDADSGIASSYLLGESVKVVAKVKPIATNTKKAFRCAPSDCVFVMQLADGDTGFEFLYWDNGNLYEQYADGGTRPTINKGVYSEKWYIVKFTFISDTKLIFEHEDFSPDEVTDPNYIPEATDNLKIALYSYDGQIQCDYVFVAKYVEPEPSVTVEYVSETVTYSDYFYWGMAKMLSGAIMNFIQLPITMEIYSAGNLLKTLSLKEINTISDTEQQLIISVLKFEDDSSDSYTTDKQIVYVTDPNGTQRKLAESTYVFIKVTELPLLLGFEIQIPYEDTQVLLP